MQWRPLNRKLAVCLTENEIKNRIVTCKLTSEHYTLYFFAIHLNLEQQLADYRERALIFSVHS